MPKLKNELDNLEGLSDRRSALYTKNETTGKYDLGDDYRQEDVAPLTNALERIKQAKAEAEATATALQEKIDADAIKMAELSGDKDEIDRLNQAKLDKQKQMHDKALSDAVSLNHELTIGSTRDTIANEVYLKSDAWKMTDMESRIKLNEDGKTTYLVNRLGETVTKEAFIAELKGDESMAFAIKGVAGSGGGQGKPSGSDDNPGQSGGGGEKKSLDGLSPKEMVAEMKLRRPELAK